MFAELLTEALEYLRIGRALPAVLVLVILWCWGTAWREC
jgi:hypothetical protein